MFHITHERKPPYFRHSSHRMTIDVRHTTALSHRTIFVVFTCRSVTVRPNLKPVNSTYITTIEKEQYDCLIYKILTITNQFKKKLDRPRGTKCYKH